MKKKNQIKTKKQIKIISIILSGLMLITQSAYAKDYPQKFWEVAKEHWAFTYIADLAERGIINGYEDGSFKPSRTVTRAEWAKIMVDAAGVSKVDNTVYYTDMSNHWANKYVNAARIYLTGYTDGSYRPDQAATREDVTVAMVRIKGYDLSEVDYSYLSNFTDVDSISNYAKGYVAVAVQNNLISGFDDGTFKGQATLTRAEAATLLYRAFQHGNADKVIAVPEKPSVPIITTEKEEEMDDKYLVVETEPEKESVKKKPIEIEEEEVLEHEIIESEEIEAEIEETEEVEIVEETKEFSIDTLAEVSSKVSSMVVDNDNVLHYVVDEQVYNTNGEEVDMDIVYDIGYDDKNYDYSLKFVNLAYDNYNGILYLLANDKSDYLIIFDITDYNNPKPIINRHNCDKIKDLSVTLQGDAIYPVTHVLKNGALVLGSVESDIVSARGDSRHNYKLMINPESFAFSKYEEINNTPSIEGGLVVNNGNNIVYKDNKIYFWNNGEGYVMIDKEGYRHIIVSPNDIEILDYKQISRLNIWNAVVDKEESFIFYDNSDLCIRKISKIK